MLSIAYILVKKGEIYPSEFKVKLPTDVFFLSKCNKISLIPLESVPPRMSSCVIPSSLNSVSWFFLLYKLKECSVVSYDRIIFLQFNIDRKQAVQPSLLSRIYILSLSTSNFLTYSSFRQLSLLSSNTKGLYQITAA